MNQITSIFENGADSLFSIVSGLLGGLLLLLVAWLVATLFKKAITKGLKAINFDKKLVGWNFVSNQSQGEQTVSALGKVVYYLVWVLFLPGIFQAFGLLAIAQPITNMINTALAFLPNVIGAVVVVVLGVFAAKFVRNLVYNFLIATNVESYLNKFLGGSTSQSLADTTVDQDSKNTLTKALSTLAYVLVLLPILLVAVETLGIQSIIHPVTDLLNTILSAIPNIIVAVILLGIGFIASKIIGELVTDLMNGTGINKYSETLRNKANVNLDLAGLTGQVVSFVIGLLFFVEALNALNLDILNTVGAAIVAYIPSVVVAGIIAVLAFTLAEFVASLIKKSTSGNLTANLVKSLIYVFAGFMILDQLNFATSIVNQAFIMIMGALAVAFALAFGLGGRDFARKQLEKADEKIEKETNTQN